ncbi:MAG TPA: hypothetical protein DCY13_08450 [Verrucomicrobiales bacterium]|nr:hypothetical protein [Verrucomicrobiales bacterium]
MATLIWRWAGPCKVYLGTGYRISVLIDDLAVKIKGVAVRLTQITKVIFYRSLRSVIDSWRTFATAGQAAVDWLRLRPFRLRSRCA